MTSLRANNLSFIQTTKEDFKPLFHDISFELHEGQFMLIQGANGSGKTTLLKVISGLLKPTIGNIFWKKKSIYENKQDYQQKIRYLSHQNALIPQLTVFENISFFSGLYQQPLDENDFFHLSNLLNRKVSVLSEGEKKRIALSAFIHSEHDIWIFDEPTTNLDDENKKKWASMVKQHIKNGGICIASSHIPVALKSDITIRMEDYHVAYSSN